MRWVVACAVLVGGGCGRDEVPLELQPDSLLMTSLGLTARDVVHRVQVRSRGAAEVAEPERTRVGRDDWVSFQGGDARGHTVRFDSARMDAPARAWLRDTDQVESPPLFTPASRWVVSFRNAPAGAYPYLVEGGGTPGSGWIELQPGDRR